MSYVVRYVSGDRFYYVTKCGGAYAKVSKVQYAYRWKSRAGAQHFIDMSKLTKKVDEIEIVPFKKAVADAEIDAAFKIVGV